MYYILLAMCYLAALFLPMTVYLALCFVLAIRYRGLLCLIIAGLIDIQFGLIESVVPMYVLSTMVVLILAEVIRPRLMIETTL